MTVDYVVIGGGIVGLSTAWQLQQRIPDASIVLVEKEDRLAAHQTGRNSGVIHAGIYYTPGSLKAKFCKEGVDATISFCRENDIPVEQCGKLLVATDAVERERMLALYERAKQNGLDVELLDANGLREREPNIAGVAAIFVRTTGIVDYAEISRHFARKFKALGGEIRLRSEVVELEETDQSVVVSLRSGNVIETRYLIACGGLIADRLASMLDIDIDFQVIPFRGEYYKLSQHMNDIVNHLIYPIPDPALPFLGVHLTRMIDGSVTVGPNAVLSYKREGYDRLQFSLRDVWSMVRFSGFWRVVKNNFANGVSETWNSFWKRAYLRRVQKYCPGIKLADLRPHPCGIRAMAVKRDGTLVHDFLFANSERSLHVCSAPSPAATSAIPIGSHICDTIIEQQRLGQAIPRTPKQ